MERYAAFLPVSGATPNVSLGEGYTPLVHARNLGRMIGTPLLHLKVEGANPTGSFKDRGMALAVAKALEAGSRAIVCASTGNTAASAAAYGAAANLEVVVVLPRGQIAKGKLLQAQVAGARVVGVDGNFDKALDAVRELVEGGDAPGRQVTLVNSINPHRLAGQKTAAFEICEDLGGAPDYLAIPVGNAGNISAYWQGFNDYRDAELVETRPKMLGFQAEGAAPLVVGHAVSDPKTVATAIKIGNPASGQKALRARDESGGVIEAVTDEEILAAYHDLARHEGIFCEPASAASVAGLRKMAAEGRIDPGATIVCVLTGHGLKDPDTAMRTVQPPIEAAATADGLREALGW
jgi:threonine synthase